MDVLLAGLARQEHDVSDKVVHGDEEQKDRPDANDPVHLLDVNVYRQSTLDPLRKIKKGSTWCNSFSTQKFLRYFHIFNNQGC